MSEENKEPLEETPVTAETAETEQEKTPENQEPVPAGLPASPGSPLQALWFLRSCICILLRG